jgi:Tfp pilus assembly protein PilX
MSITLSTHPTAEHTQAKRAGFVLIFTILIVGTLLVPVIGMFSFVVGQIKISRDEYESARALYAADTGIECVRYHQKKTRAFDTSKSQQTIDCGVGTITAGVASPGAECTNYDYPPTTLSGFSNGVCTIINIQVKARTVTFFDGTQHQICDLFVTSSGRNTCTGSFDKVVERSRWENM